MRKIHMTRQFFEAIGPQGHYFEKQRHIFRYGPRECVYQISGLYRFLFSQQVPHNPQT